MIVAIADVAHLRLMMMLSTSEFANLAFLELIEEGVEPPDGLDINKLADDGLVTQQQTQWTLTQAGLTRLQRLRSLARSFAQMVHTPFIQ